MTNIEIGNRIKYARNLRKSTLDDVAKKVGVTKSTIQRYEAGKITTIKLPVVEAIAIALNVNPAWVVGKSDIMELPSQKIPKIMQYYKQLNDIGKETATEHVRLLTLDEKYTKPDNVISIVKESESDYLAPNAAHSNDGATQEEIQHDADIMDTDEEWN